MSRDLMHGAEVRQLVRDAYRDLPPTTAAVAEQLYSEQELAQVPQCAVDRSLGVANHLRYAGVRPGETVLDLGCGGGIDTVLAARRTGPTGRVLALDFLPEMLRRTARAAAEAGVRNVETLEAEMEAVPLPDDSVDLVISNGVINLSPRKARVLAECARVLRPGGRLCVSDLTTGPDELPPEILTQPAAWAGCVSGALAEDDFVRKLERAGFHSVDIPHRRPLTVDDCALYPLFAAETIQLMRTLLPPVRQQAVAISLVIRAEAGPPPPGPASAS
ncbi:methyltransferase domain-containing protein [Streptomyces alkaliterrae]|uniref:Arsenite methyltransferase n=1 Tax=Streptomyces alkaliterrae TaxID=2213162 RepID=A0A5P0YLR5_9ACTN|nr:methyltransferase domain-containing protein [Streptomyces alkaliterrae]MBB1251805.1 methyltransferase domain-containing protein [Streptomyces alkaliterrae]MBB1257817.1 methyltransferase domain-containing protein [Streptomyces alkaliterrae]MQS01188.1 methyltransferase domain-containing protein [Streptomyces alkaliterrae]